MKECPVCRRCFPDQVNHCPTDGDALKFTIAGDPLLDGRYQLECRLGQGGMGLVYKARHIFLKTLHAIKIILPDLVGNDPSLVTRFRQEAMAAAAIRHPNIVAVTDFGVVGGTTPFLVMEFIQGKSLNDILQEQGRVSPEFAAELMTGVCAGLSAAHRQGIIHRDLKPLNIMLRNDAEGVTESVKLLDFGLAKIKSGELLGSFVAAQTTGLMGSPFYMAPEQWGEEEPDRRADVYSLGVILYQMLAGEVPYRGPNIPAIMKKHLTDAPPPLAGKNPSVTPEVEQVVQRALAKDPNARPQTVEEFVSELRAAAGVGSDAATTGSFRRPLGMDTVSINRSSDTMHAPQATGENLGGTVASAGGGFAPHTEAQMPAPPRHADARPTTPIDAGLIGRDAEAARGRGGETGRPLGVETAYAGSGDGAPEPGESSWAPTEALPSAEQLWAGPASATAPETQVIDPRLVERKRQELLEAERRDAEEEAAVRAGNQPAGRSGAQPTVPLSGGAPQTPAGQQTVSGQFGLTREILPSETIAPNAFDSRPAASPQHGSQGSARTTTTDAEPTSSGPRVGAVTPTLPTQPSAPPITVHPPPSPAGRFMKYALAGVLGLVALGAVVGVAWWAQSDRGERRPPPTPTPASTPLENGTPVKPDLVHLPGGTFEVGLKEVPPFTDAHTPAYLQWMYTQHPAHAVRIAPFGIDRTEVTSAEYAQFVAETGYPPPPGIWEGNRPKPGQELWPVRNVSLEDAQRFAVWRSKRDGVTYRLPTEEEWEYAARGGDTSRLFPWGAEWAEGRANLDSDKPVAVGSLAEGNTPQGVSDMIGNVWEWTSSEASMYPGNQKLRLPPESAGMAVVRGGSYQSKPAGDNPITAATRTWMPKDKKDPVIGFRLVRVSGGQTSNQ